MIPAVTPSASESQVDTVGGEDSSSAAPVTWSELPRGALVDRYVVLELAGRGGMGAVYAAHDAELDRKVALKLLRGDRARPQQQQALLLEARNMARLAHPNVVTVHDVGIDQGRVWVAMEFVEGQTLRAWLGEQPRSCREIASMFAAAGRGLAAAHAAALAHRDFKPENVLIGGDGRARVTDFGLARGADAAVIPTAGSSALFTDPSSTETVGARTGTPPYMAPEQHRGARGDAKSDQFSFCVALYEALWGQRPFRGESIAELVSNVLEGRIDEPAGVRVPRQVRVLVLRGLAIDPALRHPSMDALVDALLRSVAPARRAVRVTIGAVGLSAIAAAIGWPSGPAPCSGAEAEMAGVWDPQARAAVGAALRSTALAYAETTARVVAESLDQHTTRWIDQHRDACEATAVRQEQSATLLDRRMACLADVRERVGALVAVLHEATPAIAERAVAATQALPPPERCAALNDLLAGPDPPPADSAEAVAALRGRLAHLHALEAAGEYARGYELARTLADEADALDYGPLTSEVHARAGSLAMRSGAPEPALDHLERAYFVAVELAYGDLAAESASLLAWVVADGLGRHDAGRSWAQHAIAQARHADPRGLIEARALSAAAIAAFSSGDYNAALARHGDALELREQLLPVDHLDLAQSHAGIASALLRLGQNDDALAHNQLAAELRERTLGDSHPLVANSLANMGSILVATGRYKDAEATLRRGVAIAERALPDDHPMLATIYDNLAIALDYEQHDDEAMALLRRAIAIKESRFGAESPQLATTLNNLASLLHDHGELVEGIAIRRRLLVIDEHSFDPEHPEVAVRVANLAQMLAQSGEIDEALVQGRRAWAVAVGLEPSSPARITIAVQVVELLLLAGEAAEAVAIAESERGHCDGVDRAHLDFALARALVEIGGDRARARALAESARVGLMQGGEQRREEAESVSAWLRGG